MRLRRGRKSMDRRCGNVIEAKPTLGQISPSEVAWAPRGQTGRRLDDQRPPPTRGQQRSQRNQVCLRINGGKTAARERQALPHLRSETESASWKNTSMRAAAAFGQRFRTPDAELRVAGHGSKPRGYASIWSRRASD